jgi:hypothetical protein
MNLVYSEKQKGGLLSKQFRKILCGAVLPDKIFVIDMSPA